MHLAMTIAVKAAGQTIHVRLDGVQEPKARLAAFAVDTTPAGQGLGHATETVVGNRVYVHYPLLDTLHAANPKVKQWIEETASSSGALGAVGAAELSAMHGIHVSGTGKAGAISTTEYTGTLDLEDAVKANPQLQQFLAGLPSAAASVLKGTATLVLSVGSDGYVHGTTETMKLPVSATESLDLRTTATLDKFGEPVPDIKAPPASQVMTLAQFQAIVGGGASAADTKLLNTVVLTAADVGAGYKRRTIPGGTLVQGETTLDLCEQRFPSESLRTARLQVAFDADGKSLDASNEVVTYSPGGAQRAIAEVTRAAKTCKTGHIADAGLTNAVRELTNLTDPRLLPGSVAVEETESGTYNGKHVVETTVAVYQVKGNVLSGVYGFAEGKPSQALRSFTLRLAELSAARLTHHVA